MSIEIPKNLPLFMPHSYGNAPLALRYNIETERWICAYGINSTRGNNNTEIRGVGTTIEKALDNLLLDWERFKSASVK